MLSVKQSIIKYHFLSLWYDSTWDWTQVMPVEVHRLLPSVLQRLDPIVQKVINSRSSFRHQMNVICHPHGCAPGGRYRAFRHTHLIPEVHPSLQYLLCRAEFIVCPLGLSSRKIPMESSIFYDSRVWVLIRSWLAKLKWPCIKSYLRGWMNIADVMSS